MLIKILLTLSLILLSACKSSFPEWPEKVKSHFYLAFDQAGEPHCFSYEIISTYPYKLGEAVELSPLACEGLQGYLPHEMKDITSYANKVNAWVQKECK